MITFDTSLLIGYYQAKNGGSSTGTTGLTGSDPKKKYAPTAPWAPTSTAAKADALVKSALAGRNLINENAAQLDLPGASQDYKKLFALHQGLAALEGLAARAGTKGVTDLEMMRLKTVFTRGLAEIAKYTDTTEFDQLRITRGTVGTSTKATVGVPKNTAEYVTDTIFTGAATTEVPAFQGDAKFDIQIKKLAGTLNVSVDLAEMTLPRTMANVTNYINSKLQAQGVLTRFAIERTPGAERKIEQANGKTITLPAAGDTFAFRVKGDSSEKLTFSAVTKPAVYVTTYSGDPDPDKNTKTIDGKFENRLIKLDPAGATGAETRVDTETLEGTIKTVRTTKVAADGSMYMLADVEQSVAGQAIKGQTDVALLKYDSAGKLLYARTLGSAENATGLGLAISADGKIAISGSVAGGLEGATNGPINSSATSGKSDSFVTLFDAKGDEVWTMRRGATDNDEASAVAFGADGNVYVAGRTKSVLPVGTGAVGGWDNYLTAYSTTDKGAPKALFTQQFGTALDDKIGGLVVNGDQVIVAGSENGKAVLRSFEIARTETKTVRTVSGGMTNITTETYVNGAMTNSVSNDYSTPTVADQVLTSRFTSSATATAGETRDLGDLAGGSIAGLELSGGQLYIAGQTRNGSLGFSDINGTHAGGMDAFAGRLSTDLSTTSDDALTYYGGVGDNTVTGMAVADGKVWVVGSAGADLPGLTAHGTKEGYVAALDVATGAVSGDQRISGKDNIATATSISVDTSGGSALDKFGLPKGALTYEASQKVVSATSARAGDSFQIRTRNGTPMTITLAATDTLETLASTIRRKAGSGAKVEIVSSGATRTLKISPSSDGSIVEILPGKGGKDLLEALGLNEGIVRRTEVVGTKIVSTAAGGESYGLDLDLDINFTTAEQIHHAQSVLNSAMGKIRTAYKDLETAAKPKSLQTTNASANGPVPAYLTAQIANYQAGLARLTGGY